MYNMQQRRGVLHNFKARKQPATAALLLNKRGAAVGRGGGYSARTKSILMMIVIAIPVLAFGVLFWASMHIRQQSISLNQHRPIERQAAEDDITTSVGAGAMSSNKKPVDYHIVFSTGCSAFQDWQSFLFYHQAWKSGQPGTVTRIVSGCDPDEQITLQRIFDDQIAPMLKDNKHSQQRFAIHFTPDYSHVKVNVNYKYFNKPYGMKHWMENALGFPSNPQNEEAIVILLDPDQLIIRPFVDNNFTNTAWKFIPKNETPYASIQHGRPMGQMYGFYLQWKQKINMTLVLQDEHADELPSPVDALDNTQAQRGYIVGPPYIATARDMYAIVVKWSQLAPKVHDQYPFLLAEMFAYCLAAAHLQLPHQTAASFMVSDIDSNNGEGWKSHVDTIPNDQVCDTSTVVRHREAWPNVIHFCQRYGWGPYFFGKHRLPKTFLTCPSPLLAEPPSDLLQKYDVSYVPPHDEEKHFNKVQAKRNAFVLCHLIPALNAAAEYFKQNHCVVTPNATTKVEEIANFKKTLLFSHKLGDEYDVPK